MSGVTHIAGIEVQVGQYLRQRCAWCGAVLVDYDLTRVAVPIGTDPKPATWPGGELVMVDGPLSTLVPHVDGSPVPDDCCAKLDPEVTR